MPSLVDIIADLEDCVNYQSHDVHTAFKYLEDLRKDLLQVALHLQQLRGEFNVVRDNPTTTTGG